ncbi:hypothetical protein HDU76_013426 [Blyttiomyces sp. JEL0837]|nr:hypothetical protein HDU76_013426 [Blyttiomyces sp. JEL0837]
MGRRLDIASQNWISKCIHRTLQINLTKPIRTALPFAQIWIIAKDFINILVKNDSVYGFIHNTYKHQNDLFNPVPVTLLDEQDEYNPLNRNFNSFGVRVPSHIVKCLESSLINIPLRMCWMDIIEGYVRENPLMMAIIAIIMDHLDLLKLMVEDMKLLDMDDIFNQSILEKKGFNPYIEATRNGNLDMMKFLGIQEDPIMTEAGCVNIWSVAVERGYLDILVYLENHQGEEGLNDFVDNVDTYTTTMDVWDWHLELCWRLRKESCLSPIPIDKESVERIVNKIDNDRYELMARTMIALAQHRLS